MLIEDAFAVLRNAGLTPGARTAFNAILEQIMHDFDPDGRAWSERAKCSMLIESLGAGIGADHAGMADSSEVTHITPVTQSTAASSVIAVAPIGRTVPTMAIAGNEGDLSSLIAQAMREARSIRGRVGR